MSKPTLAIATHEAGHAVALLLNQPGPFVRFLKLDVDAETLGLAAADFRWDVSDSRHYGEKNARQDIVEALAGPVAERRQRRHSWDGIAIDGLGVAAACFNLPLEPGSDLAVVHMRAVWLTPDDPEEAFHAGWLAAIDLVQNNWRRIDVLGRWLLQAGHINGDDLYNWWDKPLK